MNFELSDLIYNLIYDFNFLNISRKKYFEHLVKNYTKILQPLFNLAVLSEENGDTDKNQIVIYLTI